MATYPKIHLAMDNAFASKRWTTPDEWARIIRDCGVRCIEASADAEADPFTCGPDYMDQWAREVVEASRKYGVSVVNLYTGVTTYRTLGLAHPDVRVRQRVMNEWLMVMARAAARTHSGLGFYLHAMSEKVLQDPDLYAETRDKLFETLAEVARLARAAGPVPIIVEQMYAPHQIPWTIDGTFLFLSEVSRRSGLSAYIAVDTGHQTGQHRFLRPSREEIERGLKGGAPVPYLGPESAYRAFEESRHAGGSSRNAAVTLIEKEMDRFPYLFADARDGDLYAWLAELGCYSPIVHLQQSDGKSSSHLPFTPEFNATGIVQPLKVLQAIARSCERPGPAGMPKPCEDIYLTFEIFSRTSDRPRDILPALAESVRYWRQWVPQDGESLETLLGNAD
ncbi:MAG: TIM barrel protein [Spirochaetia bacterium]